ncbi:MAG: aminopeptidase [Candidatus Acetothermia bacterium]|jgi:aminopeptidase|nr:aminopeptidase [Candidatus Acetothermia bacterium]MDH7505344.1 aminopeptidase [Candidatus Acetothermia bacterium]
MADPRVEAVAKILVEYSVEVKPNQLVRITGAPEGAPLLLAVYQEVLKRGAHPWLQLGLEGAEELFYTYASEAQLDYVPPFMKEVIEQIDANIGIWTEVNTKQLTNADPAKQARRAAAMRPLNERFLERAAKKELRWTGTVYPTQAFAQDAEMSLREFEKFVYKACLVDEPNPIGAWRAISQRQQRLVDRLNKAKAIHVTGPDTDLKLEVAGRRWENCDGHENFPDGEIFTGPVEESVNGHIRFSYPACLYGREVEDVRLTFKDGKVVEAKAAKNEQFLLKMLETDEGARYVGEFAFGTNPGIQRFTKNTLFDEKIGGTIHLALGKGYPETGSKNSSAIHWDMVCDLREGGEVRVDGTLFLKDGKILV